MATTYNLGDQFELTIDPKETNQFELKLISPDDRYSGVLVERRYISSDNDPSHPAKQNTVPAVRFTNLHNDEGDNLANWRKGRIVTVTKPGIYYCDAQEYDTDTQKYWISVNEAGRVEYLDKEHPTVKNGYALVEACENGDMDAVKHLLEEEHVNPNLILNAWGPVHHAAQNGFPEIVTLLAQHGADVDDIQNWIWVTPLQMVGDKNHRGYSPEVVKILVAHGADPNNHNANLAKSIVEYAKHDQQLRKAIHDGLELRKK